MVIDLRKQKRIIKIELEIEGSNFDLDEYIDSLLRDLRIISEQRQMPEGLKTEIILE